MTDDEKRQYALVDHVSSATPPAFLTHAYDDDVVPIEESQLYAKALTAAGQEVESHFFAKGDQHEKGIFFDRNPGCTHFDHPR